MNTRFVGLLGAVISFVLVLSLLDIVVSGYREPKRTYRALPGTEQPVNGKLERPIDSPDELTYQCETSAVRIVFSEAKGTLWRGRLTVDEGARERDYRFVVLPKMEVPMPDTPVYTIRVFEDKARYQASSTSIAAKYLGVAPWWISVVTFPLALLSFGAAHIFSTKEEARLARKGIAEIYRVARRDKEWEITFGLGGKHGIGLGDEVILYDEHGRPIGNATVTKTGSKESCARIAPELIPLKPNSFVSKQPDPGRDIRVPEKP